MPDEAVLMNKKDMQVRVAHEHTKRGSYSHELQHHHCVFLLQTHAVELDNVGIKAQALQQLNFLHIRRACTCKLFSEQAT